MVIHTTNEGNNWEIVDIGTKVNLNGIVINEITQKGWIAGNEEKIFYTDDEGKTWIEQLSSTC